MTNWIKCSDRLPEKFVSVLLYAPYVKDRLNRMAVGFRQEHKSNVGYYITDYVDCMGYSNYLSGDLVTHWAELPEPPEDLL